MSRVACFIGIAVAAFVYCGCSKPPHIHAGGRWEEPGPMVREVKLVDTISPGFTSALHLEHITGSAFLYPSGDQVSYFTYAADTNKLLIALSQLAFPLRDTLADVTYRTITGEEWRALRSTVDPYEISGADFFWDADPSLYDIYVSTKVDHHLVLIGKVSGQVMHRISHNG